MPVNGSENQFGWAQMELLLQCPVCLDCKSNGNVEQCSSGHHICFDCKSKVTNCPLCKCDYTGTRNFVVEELMRNLVVLKNTMLLNALAAPSTTKKVKRKKQSIVVTKTKIQLPSTPTATKGCYPCVIRSCDVILPVSRMLNHVRSLHSRYFSEGLLDTSGTFTVTFSLTSSSTFPLYKWQKVLFINGIGLVFFTYVILKNGYLIATVQMAAKQQVAHTFKCILTVKNTRGAEYQDTIKLSSTREKMENILYGKQCMLLNAKQTKYLRQQTKVNCILEFSAVKEADVFVRNYPRLETKYLKNILIYYNHHDKNDALL